VRNKLSLKTIWMALIVLVGVLPAMILLSLYRNTEYNYQLDEALWRETHFNNMLRLSLEAEVKRYVTLLQNKSDPIAFTLKRKQDQSLVGELLDKILQREPAMHGLLVLSAKGELVAAYDRQQALLYPISVPPTSMDDSQWLKTHWNLEWKKIVRSPELLIPLRGRVYIGSALVHNGNYIFRIAVPVGDSEQPEAILLAEIDVKHLWSMRQQPGSQKGVVSYLLDRRGSLLTETPGPDAGKLLTHLGIVRSALADKAWDVRQIYQGLAGLPVYGTVTSVSLLNWSVVSEIPEQVIAGPIRKDLLYATTIIVGFITLFAGIGLWLVKKMSWPVSQLTAAMDYFAKGKMFQPIGKIFINELNVMASSFNSMVAERTQMERTLRNSEARLADAQRIAHIGSWELDLVKNEMWWSEEVYRMFDMDPRKFGTSYEAFLEVIHPDDRERVNATHTDSLRNKTPYNIEHRLCIAGGTIKHVQTRCKAVYDAEGHPIRCVGTMQDITERVSVEEALRRSQKMEAIGQLSGGIAHDFNNQLGIIIGYLDFLKGHFPEGEKPRQWVDTATRATLRSMDLTRQLLAISRRQNKEKVVVDLNAALQGLENMIARSVTPEVEVQYFLADELWPTEIDPGEFQDAILNLVINARDAMPAGGKLLIETSDKRLDADYSALNPGVEAGDYVQVMLSDTGTGMDKETLERIFEPFFTTKPEGKGTGLGLAMVYGFAKRYGGYIRVYSEPGVGTTIRMYLPRSSTSESAGIVNSVDEAESPTGSETILIVDDEVDLLQLAGQYLSELGYHTHLAGNAAQALDILTNEEGIDLLFSDVVMPGGMNGYELAQQATRQRPDLKMLLTSGFTAKTTANNGLARFSACLLRKPYRKAELAQRIRLVLDKDNLTGRTILVVDDEESVRELFKLNLDRLGCKTLPACNGDEAIALYRQSLQSGKPIDVVILDLTLPGGMGGKEIAEKIRVLDPQAKMIVASGYTEGPEMTHYQDYGFSAALEKNFNREKIKQVLEQVLSPENNHNLREL